jgi:hypothetical protein
MPEQPTTGEWKYCEEDHEDEHLVVASLDAADDFDDIVVGEFSVEADARLCAESKRMLAALRLWAVSIAACQDPELWHHLREAREATTKIISRIDSPSRPAPQVVS